MLDRRKFPDSDAQPLTYEGLITSVKAFVTRVVRNHSRQL